MKQKIKIMNHKPELTDEEIHSYMNFNRVLENSKIAIDGSRTTTFLKFGIPVAVASLIIAGFFLLKDDGSKIDRPVTEESNSQPQSPAPVTSSDSTTRGNDLSENTKEQNTASVRIPATEKVLEKPIDKPEQTEIEGYTQAEPVNGYAHLYDYFNANLIYPPAAINDSIQGVQTISFIINKEGRPEQIEVEQSLGEEFEKESIRLIENMPEWKPAKLDGAPVRSKISIPLTFQIQKTKN
jgi:TonB family protein